MTYFDADVVLVTPPAKYFLRVDAPASSFLLVQDGARTRARAVTTGSQDRDESEIAFAASLQAYLIDEAPGSGRAFYNE